MKKATLILVLSLFGSTVFASQKQTIHCNAVVEEEGHKKEIFNFEFDCDNYGEGATFKSKSKRFLLSGFSEESCTPVVILHDNVTNTASLMFASEDLKGADGLDVYTGRVVGTSLYPDINRKDEMFQQIFDAKTFVNFGCSTDKDMLDKAIK